MPVSCAFAKLVGVDCVQVQSRGVAQCVQTTLCRVYNDLRMRMRMSFNKLILICILTHSHWPNENELF